MEITKEMMMATRKKVSKLTGRMPLPNTTKKEEAEIDEEIQDESNDASFKD